MTYNLRNFNLIDLHEEKIEQVKNDGCNNLSADEPKSLDAV